MAFIQNTTEALAFIQDHVKRLEEKLKLEIPTVQQFNSYRDVTKDVNLLHYQFISLNENFSFTFSSWSTPFFKQTPEELAKKFTTETWAEKATVLKETLATLVSNLDVKLKEVRETNEKVIANNKEVRNRAILLMTSLGVPATHSEVVGYKKDAFRTPKRETRSAGYILDLHRSVPIMEPQKDSYDHYRKILDSKVKELDDWIASVSATINQLIKKREQKEVQRKKDLWIPTMKVKYNVPFDADHEYILTAILEHDKYLRLAHWMRKNRGDWNDGSWYAERGLGRFEAISPEDVEIFNCVQRGIDSFGSGMGDGRVFRDMEWSYDVIFTKADPKVMADYTMYNELFGGY
jgi:hypothetical protein